MHYHLSEICVKKGQSVVKGTLLGKTGKTGKATGVHLHLGVKDLKTEKYEDPEIFSKNYVAPTIFRPGTYKVDAAVLNVRSGAGTTYGVKTFSQFTANARAQIKKLNGGSACNGYVNGVVCTVSKVSNEYWGKTPSGWICLKYCIFNILFRHTARHARRNHCLRQADDLQNIAARKKGGKAQQSC